MPNTPLRVLFVEDSPADATLTLRELTRGDFAVESLRVDTAPAFLAALEEQPWDVILSDFSMPEFNGMAAFDLLMDKGLDIPFIFVSGRIGEDRAAEAMRRGAKDYILKDNLKRLVPAIRRELKEAGERRKRQGMADALRESDEKLHAHERLLQTVFDTIPHALMVKDRNSRYLMVNKAWCERYGLAAADVVGKPTLEIPGRASADRQRAYDEDRAVFDRGDSVVFDGIGAIRGREPRHYHTVKAPLKDVAGQIIGLVGATVDMTELKRAEEALRRNNEELAGANEELQALHHSLEAEVAERTKAEQSFRQLVDLAPQALVAVNADGRIVLVNAQALASFGYRQEELLGQPVEMLIPERCRAGHPARVSGFFRAPSPRAMGAGLDLYGLRKDGSEFPVDICLGPIETADGLQAIAAIVDMTAIRRAEAEVRASQRLLQTVFDTIPVHLVVKDSDTRYLMVNRAWTQRYGLSSEQVIGKTSLEILGRPEKDRQYTLEQDRATLTGERNLQVFEGWDRTANGEIRHYQSLRSPLRDEQGKIIGLVGATVDLTEQKRAEEKLRANERLLQTVFDTIPYMLVVKDRESRFLMVNNAWCDTYGISAEQATERSTLQIPNFPDAESRRFFDEDRSVLEGGEPQVIRDKLITVKEGRQIYVHSIKAPLRSDRGQVIGLVGAFVDVTAEKLAHEKADRARARLVDAIESLPAAFLLFDSEERLVLWNSRVSEFHSDAAAKLNPGMNFAEWLRLSADSVVNAQGRTDEAIQERLAQFRTNPGTFEFELTDGRWLRGLDRRTADGGTVCLRFDITESKRQEEMLRQSQKLEAIGSLAGGISHDFNNLLTVISSHAEFIAEGSGGPEQSREDAQMILDAGARAAALTRQLLAFSRKQVLQMKVLDLNAIVDNLEKMLHRLIGEDIELRASPAPSLEKINADPTQIEQIVMNLVVNARDAMPRGGKLLIETANKALDSSYAASHSEIKPGDYVMLAVTDTGHGMDKATQARIFEPFFTTKPLGKGTGMGLATVYGIVKQMNGSVFVYSEPGKGTTFKIYFPVSAGDAATAAARESPSRRTRATETVLLVEDEDMVRKSAVRILEGEGYTVLQASSAEEALKIAGSRGARMDLLLSDVVMPGLSGRELWDRVRQTLPIRVLFMSGYTDDAIVRHGILEGSVPFINKPFTKVSLLDKVREVLSHPIPDGSTAR